MASISFTPPTVPPSGTVVTLAELLNMPPRFGESFSLAGLSIASVVPGSFKGDYTVKLVSGVPSFCVNVEFSDDGNSRLTLSLWGPFQKVIGLSAVEYVKMTVEDQVLAFEAINPAARYNAGVVSVATARVRRVACTFGGVLIGFDGTLFVLSCAILLLLPDESGCRPGSC